jgi:hypothetical protein
MCEKNLKFLFQNVLKTKKSKMKKYLKHVKNRPGAYATNFSKRHSPNHVLKQTY